MRGSDHPAYPQGKSRIHFGTKNTQKRRREFRRELLSSPSLTDEERLELTGSKLIPPEGQPLPFVPPEAGDAPAMEKGFIMGWGRIRYNEKGDFEVCIFEKNTSCQDHWLYSVLSDLVPTPDRGRSLQAPDKGPSSAGLPCPVRRRSPRPGPRRRSDVRGGGRQGRVQGGLWRTTRLRHSNGKGANGSIIPF